LTILKIGLALAGLANIAVAFYGWYCVAKNTEEVRGSFWQSTMSANHSFLTGVWMLGLAQIIPMPEAMLWWLTAGMLVSCVVAYYPQAKDQWARRRQRKAEAVQGEPEPGRIGCR